MLHQCPTCEQYYRSEEKTIRNRTTFHLRCPRCRRIKGWESRLRTTYGLSVKEYATMLLAQANACAICGKEDKDKLLYVDHDHATGKVRALLCSSCNTGLGHFRDNPTFLRAAIAYLEHHQSTST